MFTIHRPSVSSLAEASDLSPRRIVDIWPVDPRWNRVEWCDDCGVPLGIITFERRAALPRPKLRRTTLTSLNLALANLIVWLKETVSCRLSTN